MITLILSLTGWAQLARVVRGRFLSLRTEEFVTAARLDGASEGRIIFRHMLPSFSSHIIASISLAIPAMILAETSLSFLGLGLQPPTISWGVLLREAQNIRSIATAPWLFAPGVAVVLAVIALNFLGDAMSVDSQTPKDGVLLEVRGLQTHFSIRTGTIKAVDGVSFDVVRGKTLCVVGESGSGKSVTARSILQIVDDPGRIVSGSMVLHRPDGSSVDLAQLGARSREIRAVRGAEIAMIFQEPMSSLSPVHTVGNQIMEVLT
eukprot:gene27027-48521_t